MAKGATATTTVAAPISLVTVLASGFSLLVALRRSLTAFGVNPATLLATDTGTARLKDLEAQTGFRGDFAKAFRDVTYALRPRRLVVFIDDLDRCQYANVLSILEAVNFLVVSGECVLVLGLDRKWVQCCVSLAFRKVAKELAPAMSDEEASARFVRDVYDKQSPPSVTPVEQSDVGSARSFASHYLEKLINIEVPIPQLTSEQAERMITGHRKAAGAQPRAPHRLSNLSRWASGFVQRYSFAVVSLLVIFGAMRFGIQWGSPALPPADINSITLDQRSNAANATGASSLAGNRSATDRTTADRPGYLVEPQRSTLPMLIFLSPIPVVLVMLAVVGMQRRDVVIHDSPEFVAEMDFWRPMLLARMRTPRWIKRFVNRIRYYAMRYGPASGVEHSQTIPEHAIVALSVMEELWPEWLEDPELFAGLVGPEPASKGEQPVSERLIPPSAKERYRQLGLQLQMNAFEVYRQRFVEVAGAVRFD